MLAIQNNQVSEKSNRSCWAVKVEVSTVNTDKQIASPNNTRRGVRWRRSITRTRRGAGSRRPPKISRPQPSQANQQSEFHAFGTRLMMIRPSMINNIARSTSNIRATKVGVDEVVGVKALPLKRITLRTMASLT